MSRIAGFPTNNPDARKLQIRVKGKAVEVVDKETQQLIAGVSNWQVDVQTDWITGKTRHYAKIEITITDPVDIFYTPEVEGSIVEALPALPERIERRRQALAEIAQLAQDEGIYD